jgi:diphthamide synthase subunit DPH2
MYNFPEEYKEFLKKHGIISKNGVEIYGLKEGMENDGIPSVIGATKLYSKDYDIKENEWVIAFDDFYNMPIIFTSDNKVYRINDNNERIKIADSFNQFLKEKLKEIEEYSDD